MGFRLYKSLVGTMVTNSTISMDRIEKRQKNINRQYKNYRVDGVVVVVVVLVSVVAGAATAAATTATAAAATETALPLKYLFGSAGVMGGGVVVTVPSLAMVNTIFDSSSTATSLAFSSTTALLSSVTVLLSLLADWAVVALSSLCLCCSIKSSKRRVTGAAVQLGLLVVGENVEGFTLGAEGRLVGCRLG